MTETEEKTGLSIDSSTAALVPRHISKQEFGRRLYNLMLSRGWHQSELARQAGLQRDSISVYIRGRALPTPQNLAALARAFNVKPQDLLPNVVESAIQEDHPSFEMKVSPGNPNVAWLRINRLVSLTAAVRIADILKDES